MFGFINKIKNIFSRQVSENEDVKIEKSSENVLLSSNLDENIKYLRSVFDRCNDVAMRSFQINAEEPIDGFLIYIDGMIDEKLTATNVLRSLQLNPAILKGQEINRSNVFNIIKDSFLSTTEVRIVNDMTKVVENILSGQAVLLIEGTPQAIVSSVRQMEDRSVEEPQSEPLVRGPRDGFVESLRTNTTLIRRRLKTSRLKMEIFKVGTLSQTDVAVIYIDGIANDKIVDEVKRRIKRIEIDGVLESSYLEEFIEDDPSSIFPQVNTTERPDRMCACLLEGRVGILVDNTPICLIVPATFPQFLQSPEDYYNRFPYATFTRILRFVTMNIALLLPSAYIAVLTFHQEMLPTPL